MIILTTSASAQQLSVIPRQYSDNFTLSVRDDSTNVVKYYSITNATISGNYLNFSNIFNPILVENHFYDLRLYQDPNFWNTNYNLWELYSQFWNVDREDIEDIYQDRIFCTDQDIDQLNKNDHYQINEGQYKTYDGYDNTYIVR
jgi:glycosyltransferase involved in cell wall biosynthesis|tara:strand:+ start:663 stop:1094 length:432 start_codon:yes stop_codon:yes gene_type:complete